MRKYFYLSAVAALALASCTSDDIVGTEKAEGEGGAIAFNTSMKALSRATELDHTESAAALDNNYILEATKTTTDATPKVVEVIDHYNVNYGVTTAHSTQSNTNDWEYVGQGQNIKGTSAKLSAATQQTIKYWDYATSQYDFIAVSLGKGVDTTEPADGVGDEFADLTEIKYANLGKAVDASGHANAVYTLTGTFDELASAYVADLVTVYKADGGYEQVVTPRFRRAGAKVRVAFFETVPGYAVSNLKFYSEEWDGTATDTEGVDEATLFTANDFFVPTTGDGVLSVYYPVVGSSKKTAQGYNKAEVKYEPATSGGATLGTTMTLGAVVEGTKEGDAQCSTSIGRTSATASYAGDVTGTDHAYYTVIPQGKSENLQIRLEYDLYPIDGGEEVIHVRDARAVVPAAYADWKSNYAYTYIFKISEATNGWTGVGADGTTVEEGLTPITLNAIVVDTEDALIQETITEISTPSITTYALGTNGVDPTAKVEYTKNQNIYVSVEGATLTDSNVKLYTATLSTSPASKQTISEASVANAVANGGVTEVDGGKLTVAVASAAITATDKIAAADRVDGVEVAGNFAVFKPTTAGTYAFEYTDGGGKKYYKVIVVVD